MQNNAFRFVVAKAACRTTNWSQPYGIWSLRDRVNVRVNERLVIEKCHYKETLQIRHSKKYSLLKPNTT